MKHWKDNGNMHPESIEVELYDGSTLVKTITLVAKHNYAYSWKSEKAMNYSIKEKNVKGYKGIVSTNSSDSKTEYIITNTSIDKPKKNTQVKTGDMTRIQRYLSLMCGAGLILILLGCFIRYEKD